jgi:carbon-monoxide dehydrogenase medium subunit
VALTRDGERGAGNAVGELRLAVGCVGPRPQRLLAAEARARGRPLADLPRYADEIADLGTRNIDATTDLHGSAEYKREIARVFVRRALGVAAARAAGQMAHERYPHTIVV